MVYTRFTAPLKKAAGYVLKLLPYTKGSGSSKVLVCVYVSVFTFKSFIFKCLQHSFGERPQNIKSNAQKL